MAITLGELAAQLDLELRGDASHTVSGVCTLADGRPDALAFLANPQYRGQLPDTAAGAVIVSADHADASPTHTLVAANPYLAYAKAAALIVPPRAEPAGIADSATVAASARLGEGAAIAPGARIADEVRIGQDAVIGANAVIERGVTVGDGARIGSGVTLCEGVTLGDDVTLHPGVVIGSRGFGLAPGPDGWIDVPQLGSVVVGNRVEIGANTTIDRGAIGDTRIEDGAKLDNQIQIGHNCVIGQGTAVAGTVGIAGSTTIGAGCLIGGACMISGHLTIGDRVVITGASMVTRDIPEAGTYSGGLPSDDNANWRKQIAHLRRLDKLVARVRTLERKLAEAAGDA